MSLRSDNVGYLDITNAILRVGTLDVAGIQGVDTVTNSLRASSVLVFDDQGSDMLTPPFQLGAGALRTTAPPEIELRNAAGNNFMYTGIKLPNAWVADFELSFADLSTGNVHFQTYTESTTTYNDDGYQFIFDAANSTLTLEYGGTQVQQQSVAFTSGYQKIRISYDRGTWSVARNGVKVFTRDDGERSAVYENPISGQYLRFETTASTSRKIRFIKITNNGAWVTSNVGDISFLTGNVGVGSEPGAYRFDVTGSTRTSSLHVSGTTDSTETSNGALTVAGGLGVGKTLTTKVISHKIGYNAQKHQMMYYNESSGGGYWRAIRTTSGFRKLKVTVTVARLTSDWKTISFGVDQDGVCTDVTVTGIHNDYYQSLDHVFVYYNTSTTEVDIWIAMDSYSRAHVETFTGGASLTFDTEGTTKTSTAPTASGTYLLKLNTATDVDYRFLNGKIGINDMSPISRLSIKGDDEEATTIKVEGYTSTYNVYGNVHISWDGSLYRAYHTPDTFTSNLCGLHFSTDCVLPYNNGVDTLALTDLGNTDYPWRSVMGRNLYAKGWNGVTSQLSPTSLTLGDAVSSAMWGLSTGSYRLNFKKYSGSAYEIKSFIDQQGAYVRNVSQLPNVYLYPDGLGIDLGLNVYGTSSSRIASFFHTDEDTDIGLAIVNTSRQNNVTKKGHLAFFNTDTSGSAKLGGLIQCSLDDSNAISQKLKILTQVVSTSSGSGYAYPGETITFDRNRITQFHGPTVQSSITGEATNGQVQTFQVSYYNNLGSNKWWKFWSGNYGPGNSYQHLEVEATFWRVDGVSSKQYFTVLMTNNGITPFPASVQEFNAGAHGYSANFLEAHYNSTNKNVAIFAKVASFSACHIKFTYSGDTSTMTVDFDGRNASTSDPSSDYTNTFLRPGFSSSFSNNVFKGRYERGEDASLTMVNSVGGYYEGLKVQNVAGIGNAAGLGFYLSTGYSNTYINNTYSDVSYGFIDLYAVDATTSYLQMGACPMGATSGNGSLFIGNNGNVGIGSFPGSNKFSIHADYIPGTTATNVNITPQLVIKNSTSAGKHTGIALGADATASTHASMMGAYMYYDCTIGGAYGLGGIFGIAVTNLSAGATDPYGITPGEVSNMSVFKAWSSTTTATNRHIVHINCGEQAVTGSTNTQIGTYEKMRIFTRTNGAQIGIDDYYQDGANYGLVQIVRQGDTGDTKGHISIIRYGNTVFVIGFQQNSNRFVICPANTGNTVGVYLDSDSTSWGSLSDRRLKIVYGELREDVLDKLDQLEAVYYNFKTDCNVNAYCNGITGSHGKRIGFIAQSVKPHFPEVVSTDVNGYLGIQYTELIPVITRATQLLHKKVRESPYTISKISGVTYSSINDESNLVVSRNGDLVTLSTKYADKAYYGVIVGQRQDSKDKETLVQNTGEGWCWVVNSGGALEAGDYVTTSNVIPGYATKQEDDVPHNYTVGKVLHDVAFDYKMVPVRRTVKETVNVTYYRKTVSYKVTDDEWNKTPENMRFIGDDVYYTLTTKERTSDDEQYDETYYEKTNITVIDESIYENLPEFEQKKYTSVSDDRYEHREVIEIDETTYSALSTEEKEQYNKVFYKVNVQETYAHDYEQKSETEKQDWVRKTRKAKMVYHVHDSPTEAEGYDEVIVKSEERDMLDEDGQLVWELTDQMRSEYEYRYFDVDGNVTTRHMAHTVAVLARVLF